MRVRARWATRHRRVLPDFLIIGAQRCGTTSLWNSLRAHPQVGPSLGKELHFFSTVWSKGEAWYRCHFPTRAERAAASAQGSWHATFEATPHYFFHPQAPSRAAQVVPDARLVVLLREPASRAFSHYQHNVRRGFESLSFPDAIAAEPQRLAGETERMLADPTYDSRPHRLFSYVARGRYDEQLERWLRYFPLERVHVVHSEDFYVRPAAAYASTTKFLGLSDWTPVEFRNASMSRSRQARPLPEGTREQLAETFAPHNRRLEALLGRDFGW